LAAPPGAAIMQREICCMPSRLASLRFVTFALAVMLLAVPAGAQDLVPKITGDDIRRGLIWTGHLGLTNPGDPVAIFRAATQSWQKSKGYKATEQLADEQVAELLAEGDRQRESFGWSKLEDKSIGFSIGVPTKLVKFQSARTNNAALWYDFEGSVRYTLAVRYGDLDCGNIDQLYARLMRSTRPAFRVKYVDGFAMAGDGNGATGYLRVVCRTSGVVAAGIDIAQSEAGKLGVLMAAMGDSLSVSRHFNPTAIPRPKLEQPTPTAGDIVSAAAASPPTTAKPATNVDTEGKTAAIKRETRDGPALSPEQVFDKVSPAVFVVTAGERMGSAVAISEHELLTNCHVVKEVSRVTLMRDKAKQSADVVSVNDKADRCILRTSNKLEKWVTIRPYDDVKVGEPALTIGTPQGLELTVADGLVSSKRTHEGRRLIQTTAPISQGSSGGGLFDAQGHLLGITTFHLKVGQNLNFAIAAEDFAK
jgi:hypothetical protein